ncbi:glycine cleavage system aminomethyltransferase GcvT [Lipingzhangella sp. LS1_29]|uniref:Aminomethyltransferase n=1 Tax=Lipingzhangella rawalii TaxID=2055835 RepID=A0ABU2H9L1_9ACTN|nr:glycine cleavage system aminomethyltransferase GcvT [Lipingzhangella rawalii]MDS1271953.1 glycine cleavage system aminomethyltransferase GcvT [Lipingzhangella rawalii]
MTETSTDAAPPRHTPLHETHERLQATMVDFAGWLMPLRYGSETSEHQAVREAAGLFDLSHMGELRVRGPQAGEALDYALVGHLSAVTPGRARYTMMTDTQGGVVDDVIVYRLAEDEYLVVANAANRDVVEAALRERVARFDAEMTDLSSDYALIALQGPRAVEILRPHTDADLDSLKYYAGHPATVAGHPAMLARTGYTGEDGFEIFLYSTTDLPRVATEVWEALSETGQAHGLIPAGLSARDTLRLEAGMPLYGHELSTELTPFEAGLGRVVKLEKPSDFVGRSALAARAEEGPRRRLVGLVGRGRRVPREGYAVLRDGQQVGVVTSGAPSPAVGRPIAMAYVDPASAEVAGTAEGNDSFAVDVRGRAEAVDVVQLPFYKRPR